MGSCDGSNSATWVLEISHVHHHRHPHLQKAPQPPSPKKEESTSPWPSGLVQSPVPLELWSILSCEDDFSAKKWRCLTHPTRAMETLSPYAVLEAGQSRVRKPKRHG